MSLRPVSIVLLFAACLGFVAAGPLLGLGAGAQVMGLASAFAVFLLLGGAKPAPPDREQPPSVPQAMPQGSGRALLHAMPAPLVVISADRRLTYVNPAARDLLPRAQVGMHYSSMIRTPTFVDAIESILADHEDTRVSFSIVQQQERFFEARASFLPATPGGVFGDSDQVIVQIEDRTRDKAMLQTRTDFIANASHELRTPLASILGYIETLQGHARDDPEARELFLGIMLKQASRMQRLVDDLMSLSRIEMTAHVRPDRRIDFLTVAAEAAAAMFPQASQNDVILQIELPREGVESTIMGDRDQISQVIANLIDNAIKYGGRGKKVRVCVAEPDGRYPAHLGISVIDEGPGIARENIPRLTERFFRANPSQSKDKGGTGLGLAITKHILNRHGGALDIRSKQGEGSRFTVWIPRAPGEQVDAHRT